MRAERRLEGINLFRPLVRKKQSDLRFSNVFFPVLEVVPYFGDRHSSAVSLGSHEGECWFQDSVRELVVVSTHALPQIINDILDGNGT